MELLSDNRIFYVPHQKALPSALFICWKKIIILLLTTLHSKVHVMMQATLGVAKRARDQHEKRSECLSMVAKVGYYANLKCLLKLLELLRTGG